MQAQKRKSNKRCMHIYTQKICRSFFVVMHVNYVVIIGKPKKKKKTCAYIHHSCTCTYPLSLFLSLSCKLFTFWSIPYPVSNVFCLLLLFYHILHPFHPSTLSILICLQPLGTSSKYVCLPLFYLLLGGVRLLVCPVMQCTPFLRSH